MSNLPRLDGTIGGLLGLLEVVRCA